MSLDGRKASLELDIDIYLRWLGFAEKHGGEKSAIKQLDEKERDVLAIAISTLNQSYKFPKEVKEGIEILQAHQGDVNRLKRKLGEQATATGIDLKKRVEKSWEDIYPMQKAEYILEQKYIYRPERDPRLVQLRERLGENGDIETFEQFKKEWDTWTKTLVGETRETVLKAYQSYSIQNKSFFDVFTKEPKKPLVKNQKFFLAGAIAAIQMDLKVVIPVKQKAGLFAADTAALKKTGLGKKTSGMSSRDLKEQKRLKDKIWDETKSILFPTKTVLEEAVAAKYMKGVSLTPKQKLTISLLLAEIDARATPKTKELHLKVIQLLNKKNIDEKASPHLRERAPLGTLQKSFEDLLERIATNDLDLKEGDVSLFFEILGEAGFDNDHPGEAARFMEAVANAYREADDRVVDALGAYPLIADHIQDTFRRLETLYQPYLGKAHAVGEFSKAVDYRTVVQQRVLAIEMLRFASEQPEFVSYLKTHEANAEKAARSLVNDVIDGRITLVSGNPFYEGFQSLPMPLQKAFDKLEHLEKRNMIWAKYGADLGSGAAAVTLARLYTNYADWGAPRSIDPVTRQTSKEKGSIEIGLRASFEEALKALTRARELGEPGVNNAIADLIMQRYGAGKQVYRDLERKLEALEERGEDNSLIDEQKILARQMELVGKSVSEWRDFAVKFCVKAKVPGLFNLALNGSPEAGLKIVERMKHMYYQSPWRFAAPQPSLTVIKELTVLALMDVEGAKGLLHRLWKSYPKNTDLNMAHQLVIQGTLLDTGREFTAEMALECIHLAAGGLEEFSKEPPPVPRLKDIYLGGNFGDLEAHDLRKLREDAQDGHFYATYIAGLLEAVTEKQQEDLLGKILQLGLDGDRVLNAHVRLHQRFSPINDSVASQLFNQAYRRSSQGAIDSGVSSASSADSLVEDEGLNSELLSFDGEVEDTDGSMAQLQLETDSNPDSHHSLNANAEAKSNLTNHLWNQLAWFFTYVTSPFRSKPPKPQFQFSSDRLEQISAERLLHHANNEVMEPVLDWNWANMVEALRKQDPDKARKLVTLLEEIDGPGNNVVPEELAKQLWLPLFGAQSPNLKTVGLTLKEMNSVLDAAVTSVNHPHLPDKVISDQLKAQLSAELEMLLFGEGHPETPSSTMIYSIIYNIFEGNRIKRNEGLYRTLTRSLCPVSYIDLAQNIINGRQKIIKEFKDTLRGEEAEEKTPPVKKAGSADALAQIDLYKDFVNNFDTFMEREKPDENRVRELLLEVLKNPEDATPTDEFVEAVRQWEKNHPQIKAGLLAEKIFLKTFLKEDAAFPVEIIDEIVSKMGYRSGLDYLQKINTYPEFDKEVSLDHIKFILALAKDGFELSYFQMELFSKFSKEELELTERIFLNHPNIKDNKVITGLANLSKLPREERTKILQAGLTDELTNLGSIPEHLWPKENQNVFVELIKLFPQKTINLSNTISKQVLPLIPMANFTELSSVITPWIDEYRSNYNLLLLLAFVLGEGHEVYKNPPLNVEELDPWKKKNLLLILSFIPEAERTPENIEMLINSQHPLWTALPLLREDIRKSHVLTALQGAFYSWMDYPPEILTIVDYSLPSVISFLKENKPLESILLILLRDPATRPAFYASLEQLRKDSKSVESWYNKNFNIIERPELLSVRMGAFSLRKENVLQICAGSDEVMVFGWSKAKFWDVKHALFQDIFSPFKRVYDYTVGIKGNRTIEQIDLDVPKPNIENERYVDDPHKIGQHLRHKRFCKAALVNIVLENFKRKREGKPIIPVIFCVSGKDTSSYSAENIASKEECYNELMTHSELRRTYRLCCEFEDEEVRQAALETFKFVTVIEDPNDKGIYTLTEVVPYWKDSAWDKAWAERTRQSIAALDKKEDKTFPWKEQLSQRVNAYRDSKVVKEPPPEKSKEKLEQTSKQRE